MKVDPENKDVLYIACVHHSVTTIIKVNVIDGKISSAGKLSHQSKPYLCRLTESCTQVFTSYYTYVGSKFCQKVYCSNLNETTNIDLGSQKGVKLIANSDCHFRVNGNNLIAIQNNDTNRFEAKVLGQVNFAVTAEDGSISQPGEIRDSGISNNTNVVCISRSSQESIQIELFSSDSESQHSTYTIRETTMVKFYYPNVMIIKGCSEILVYNILEDIYYYMKLNSPILLEASTISNPYGMNAKMFIDLGDYLAFADLSITTGINCYFTLSVYTSYLEKSTFPQQRLLAGFEKINIKFTAKEEEGFTLQFKNSIMSFG